jgi:hypothetical protein
MEIVVWHEAMNRGQSQTLIAVRELPGEPGRRLSPILTNKPLPHNLFTLSASLRNLFVITRISLTSETGYSLLKSQSSQHKLKDRIGLYLVDPGQEWRYK